MNEQTPNIILIAGPNGAGKSTAAKALLVDSLGVDEFVNADTIARGLSAFRSDRVAIDAGRIMLKRLRELTAKRANLAFETTLASRSFAPWIADLRGQGYTFLLHYFWIPSSDFAVQRVAERVARGGHFVPDKDVHRRYQAGLRNFFELYMPIADKWTIYDNSRPVENFKMIATGTRSQTDFVLDSELWNNLRRNYANGTTKKSRA